MWLITCRQRPPPPYTLPSPRCFPLLAQISFVLLCVHVANGFLGAEMLPRDLLLTLRAISSRRGFSMSVKSVFHLQKLDSKHATPFLLQQSSVFCLWALPSSHSVLIVRITVTSLVRHQPTCVNKTTLQQLHNSPVGLTLNLCWLK